MDKITLPEGFCDMGVIILPEAFMIGGGVPFLFFNYTWHLPYNSGKAQETSVRVAG
jgi:hypothetical protein